MKALIDDLRRYAELLITELTDDVDCSPSTLCTRDQDLVVIEEQWPTWAVSLAYALVDLWCVHVVRRRASGAPYEPERRLARLLGRPVLAHDCKDCVYLGGHKIGGGWYDLYYCSRGGLPTVIARWGDGGPEYDSGLARGSCSPALAEALARASRRGLLPPQVGGSTVEPGCAL